jgi:hypothetical protein
MSNRRPFSNHNHFLDFNSYYSNKNSLSYLNFARSHNSIQNNNINPFFSMNECTNIQNSKKIVYYKSYDTLINLSKISSLLDPSSCNNCSDVPINLMNGLQSEVYYNDLYETECTKLESEARFCECARCLKIPIINHCYEKSGKIFPYGRFNNSLKNPAIKIQSLKNIDGECKEKLECPTYIICKCSPYNENCECCEYTTTTPFDKNSNIKYTNNSDKSCDNQIYDHLAFFSKEHMNDLQEIKNKKLQEDILLSEKAIDIYSKYGARNINHIKH